MSRGFRLVLCLALAVISPGPVSVRAQCEQPPDAATLGLDQPIRYAYPDAARAHLYVVEVPGAGDLTVTLGDQPIPLTLYGYSPDGGALDDPVIGPGALQSLSANASEAGIYTIVVQSSAYETSCESYALLAEWAPGPVRFRAMASRGSHTLALANDRSLWAWGANEEGQLGDGTTIGRSVPTRVPELTRVTQVATGSYHSLALTDDGVVWSWGADVSGQRGDGLSRVEPSAVPTRVEGLGVVTAIAGGFDHSLALVADGTVWAWGQNGSGQVGDGSVSTDGCLCKPLPVQVIGLRGATAVAAGSFHSLALMVDGTVWAWGQNGAGQLGDGTNANHPTPVPVRGLSDVMAIAAGDSFSLALKSNGTVWAWGYNSSGELGDGTHENRDVPIQVRGLTNVTQIAAGGLHGLALTADGNIWSWGHNGSGQVGDGSIEDRSTPILVPGVPDAIFITGGVTHSLAVTVEGELWAWGANGSGQLGSGSVTAIGCGCSPVPLAVHSPGAASGAAGDR
ncbi:MAG: hypothetical protein QOF51_1869 [Chloroflexota bacterium]|nr:hypothetical protein [Chloroflexota bacterium]